MEESLKPLVSLSLRFGSCNAQKLLAKALNTPKPEQVVPARLEV